MEFMSIKKHCGAYYTTLIHPDYFFINQVSRIAGVSRIKKKCKVLHNSEKKVFCLEKFQVQYKENKLK